MYRVHYFFFFSIQATNMTESGLSSVPVLLDLRAAFDITVTFYYRVEHAVGIKDDALQWLEPYLMPM